jgi:FtsH-binding integral membrane protein
MFNNDTVMYRNADDTIAAMSRVYLHMMLAVITSMVVSYGVSNSAQLMQFFFTGWMKWVTIFAPLAAIFGVSMVLATDPPRPMAIALLHGFAALMGLSFAAIFVIYKMGSIVGAFMGGAVLFGTLSFYGFFTKRNLDSIGQFLFVGLIAIVIASIINIFLESSAFQMVISACAILVFLGLTAYDTQKIREAVSVENNDTAEIVGALTLYLDFINLFLSLLQLFGDRKE